jgi:hypothetical protein
MKLNINVGDHIYNLYYPLFTYIRYSTKLEQPQEYVVLETDGNGWNILKNVKDNSIIYYGIIDNERWQTKQISLFENYEN